MYLTRAGAFATFGLGIALAVAAFWIPNAAFADVESTMSDKQSRMLKSEAQAWSKIPALKYQVTNVGAIPSSPEGLADAEITWRTIFGVPFGETVVRGGQSQTDLNLISVALAWGLFVAAELILWIVGLFVLFNAPPAYAHVPSALQN